MRTDAKIGFAIGGVLLAVLTVYAIVVPKHKKTNNSTVNLVTAPGSSSSTSTDTPSATPPIAAADTGSPSSAMLVPAKDPTPAQPTTPTIPTPQVVDNTAGGPGSIDGFHPLVIPKDTAKADEQKSAKLLDGVFTPQGSTPRVAKAKHSDDVTQLPDDTDAAATAADTLYTIKSGQTLSKIAYEVYGNSRFWVVIQRENKDLDSKHLKVGSKIKLPDISSVVPGPVTVSDEQVMPPSMSAAEPRRATPEAATTTDGHTYTVKSGDSLYGIAKRLLGSGRKADAIYNLNIDVIGPDKSKLKLGEVLKLPRIVTPAIVN
jgi:nucleoid-associated protein YgaU